MTDPLKKHLTTQLELLDESSLHLQSNICDFVQQIKTRAMGYLDKTSDTNMTMNDLLILVTKAQSTIMEHTYMLMESTKIYPPTVIIKEQTTPDKLTERLKDIETTLISLQDTKQKTEDDISEIKQWRDKFVTEQTDVGMKIEKFSKTQNQNFKNLGKQIKEQDNKINKLNQQIDSLKTKESGTDKTLEKLSLDMKEYENNLHPLNKEMRVYTDKTDHVTQEIKRHSDLISTIQEDTTKTFDTLLSKHVVMCKLLQQRLMPIDKIIETYNQNYETREGKMKKIETLEKEVLKLSQDLQSIANQQVKPSTPVFVASEGRWDGKIFDEYQIITFSAVETNVGNHFDPKTGEFTAPVDGLYKASLTIKQIGDRAVGTVVYHKSGDVVSWPGDVWTQNTSVEASETFEVRMKSGDVLFLSSGYKDLECSHFSCSVLGV